MDAVRLVEPHEQSFEALALIMAAWDEATESGVAPELIAYAAMFTALTSLVTRFGEDAVCTLARNLENRVLQGEFTVTRRLQ